MVNATRRIRLWIVLAEERGREVRIVHVVGHEGRFARVELEGGEADEDVGGDAAGETEEDA